MNCLSFYVSAYMSIIQHFLFYFGWKWNTQISYYISSCSRTCCLVRYFLFILDNFNLKFYFISKWNAYNFSRKKIIFFLLWNMKIQESVFYRTRSITDRVVSISANKRLFRVFDLFHLVRQWPDHQLYLLLGITQISRVIWTTFAHWFFPRPRGRLANLHVDARCRAIARFRVTSLMCALHYLCGKYRSAFDCCMPTPLQLARTATLPIHESVVVGHFNRSSRRMYEGLVSRWTVCVSMRNTGRHSTLSGRSVCATTFEVNFFERHFFFM